MSDRRPRHRGIRAASSFAAILLLAQLSAAPAAADSQTSVVIDPAGDARLRVPDYLDIVRVEVTETGDTFSFTQTESGPLPAVAPLVQPGTHQLWWAWGIDTDQLSAPSGFPFQFLPRPVEFIVLVFSDGWAYHGVLIDRRPLLTGGEVTRTPIPFTVSGTDVRAQVAAAAMGNPSGFRFASSIDLWSSSLLGTEGFNVVDTLSPFLTPWPS